MHTKHFVAADMRRALTLVRDELGEDAMILSTKRTSKGVEIVATSDDMSIQAPLSSPTSASLSSLPSNGSVYSDSSLSSSERGLASGKTREELAEELEQARRRMLAMQKEEKVTLSEWAQRQQSTLSQEPIQQPSYQSHAHHLHSKKKEQDLDIAKSESVSSNTVTKDQFLSLENSIGSLKSEINHLKGSDSQEIHRLQDEIASIRSMFENRLIMMAEAQERHFQAQETRAEIVPLMVDIKQKLNQLGLTQACNDQIIRSLKCVDDGSLTSDQLWKESLARVAKKIPVNSTDPIASGGIYAFLGTTGVGKTTTIAKLAARFVMEHGPDQVAILTTDTYRIAAHDQLRSLGRILNVPVKVVDDLMQLPKVLSSFTRQSLVLIDTPGMSYNDPLLKPHLSALKRCRHLQTALVLSANSQYQLMQASVHSYRVARPRFCVMTKLDECVSFGDGISLMMTNDLPLAYITDGQAVPEDISTVKGYQLMARAVKLTRRALGMQHHPSQGG